MIAYRINYKSLFKLLLLSSFVDGVAYSLDDSDGELERPAKRLKISDSDEEIPKETLNSSFSFSDALPLDFNDLSFMYGDFSFLPAFSQTSSPTSPSKHQRGGVLDVIAMDHQRGDTGIDQSDNPNPTVIQAPPSPQPVGSSEQSWEQILYNITSNQPDHIRNQEDDVDAPSLIADYQRIGHSRPRSNKEKLLDAINEVVPELPEGNLSKEEVKQFWENKAREVLLNISHIRKFSSLSKVLEGLPKWTNPVIQEKIDSIRKAAQRLSIGETQPKFTLSVKEQNLLQAIAEVVPTLPEGNLSKEEAKQFWEEKEAELLSKLTDISTHLSLISALKSLAKRPLDNTTQEMIRQLINGAHRLAKKTKVRETLNENEQNLLQAILEVVPTLPEGNLSKEEAKQLWEEKVRDLFTKTSRHSHIASLRVALNNLGKGPVDKITQDIIAELAKGAGRLEDKQRKSGETLNENEQNLLQAIHEVVPTLPQDNLSKEEANQFWEEKVSELLTKTSRYSSAASLRSVLNKFPRGSLDEITIKKIDQLKNAADRLDDKQPKSRETLNEKEQNLLQAIHEVVPTLPESNLNKKETYEFWEERARELFTKTSSYSYYASLESALGRFPKGSLDEITIEKIDQLRNGATRLVDKRHMSRQTLNKNEQNLLQAIHQVVPTLPEDNLDIEEANQFWEEKVKQLLTKLPENSTIKSLAALLYRIPMHLIDENAQNHVKELRKAAHRVKRQLKKLQ